MSPRRNTAAAGAPPAPPPRERPLTARSVAASTLLGAPGGRLPGQVLVRSGELFGISEGATRVALSRMVGAGELVTAEGAYMLTGRLQQRQARQAESRYPPRRAWDGRWRVAIVRAEPRSATERADLRDAMADLPFGEAREGVWLRPANLDEGRRPASLAVADAQCRWFDARPDDDARRLARELWDLAGWAARARDLRQRMSRSVTALDRTGTDALADAFVLSAAVLRHFQGDPLLPAALLPTRWPGEAVRRDYEDFDRRFLAVWTTWLRRAHI
jgi:phenylacetic acid degradation operon negative regulatory protein